MLQTRPIGLSAILKNLGAAFSKFTLRTLPREQEVGCKGLRQTRRIFPFLFSRGTLALQPDRMDLCAGVCWEQLDRCNS